MIDLLRRAWWKYDPGRDWFSQPYHWLNLIEGCCWLAIAALVLRRYLKHRNSRIELLYGAAFATFGLSDFREAYSLQTWLILAKGVNLIAILLLRRHVIRSYYHDSKTF